MPRRGLGRGLEALLPPQSSPLENELPEKIIEIPIDDIKPNDFQPRKNFDDKKINELASSIKEHGLVQPIVVRSLKEGKYEIVAGERRWRACKNIGLKKILAVVKDIDNAKLTELALIENVQREDLNAIEEARAYKTLMEEFGLTQQEISGRIGKSRSFIANMLRLLALPLEIQNYVADGSLSVGHARALLALENEKDILDACRRIISEGMSVRSAEALIKTKRANKRQTTKKEVKSDKFKNTNASGPDLYEVQENLENLFNTRIKIKYEGEKGKIEISFYDNKDFRRIVDILLKNESGKCFT